MSDIQDVLHFGVGFVLVVGLVLLVWRITGDWK